MVEAQHIQGVKARGILSTRYTQRIHGGSQRRSRELVFAEIENISKNNELRKKLRWGFKGGKYCVI